MKIPQMVLRVLDVWRKIGLWVGKKIAWAIMLGVYLVLFAPIAVVIKRKYNSERKLKKDSYFVAHDSSSDTQYEHQF